MNIDGAAKIHEEMLIFFLFGLEVHSREVSIFFQHLKPLNFYLVLVFFPSFGTSERSGADKNWS